MDITQVPPNSNEAEVGLLSAILLDNSCIEKISSIINVDDFYYGSHKIIFQSMIDLFSRRDPIDLITVIEYLKQDDTLDKVGGIQYITNFNGYYTTNQAQAHARIIAQKSLYRQFIQVGNKIMSMGYEAFDGDIIDEATRLVFEVAMRKSEQNEMTSSKDLMLEVCDEVERMDGLKDGLLGISSGYEDIDDLTAGMQGGELIVLAARPSMGKTALGLNIAQNVAKKGGNVAFFSLEMSKKQLGLRMVYSETPVTRKEICQGLGEKWNKTMDGLNKIAELPFFVDDTSAITVEQIRNKVRKLHTKQKLNLIVIDYIQIMGVAKSAKKNNSNREREIAEISGGLKALAKELDIPIIALAQINRSAESRSIKKPMLSDLRESGALEQDADVVMLLYRDDYYNTDSKEQNITEVIICKNRNGATGTVKLFFNKEFMKFQDLSKRAKEQHLPKK